MNRIHILAAVLIPLSLTMAGCVNETDPAENPGPDPDQTNGTAGDEMPEDAEACSDRLQSGMGMNAGVRAWVSPTEEDAAVIVHVGGVDQESAALVLGEQRPLHGTPREKFNQQVPLTQYAYVYLADGPALFVEAGPGESSRAEPAAREGAGSHEYSVPSDKEIGLSLQAAGNARINVTLRNASVVSCTWFATWSVDVKDLEPSNITAMAAEHEADINSRQFLATHCAARGGDSASPTGESMTITSEANPGQSFSSFYTVSATQSSNQPLPYGFCLHRQGVTDNLNGSVEWEGVPVNESWMQSHWFVSVTAQSLTIPPAD